MPVATEEPINPNTVIKLAGQGLPQPSGARGARGDLYIKFEIGFPEFISQENKEKLGKVLQSN
jgi:DnaJ-class molecular chaperone